MIASAYVAGGPRFESRLGKKKFSWKIDLSWKSIAHSQDEWMDTRATGTRAQSDVALMSARELLQEIHASLQEGRRIICQSGSQGKGKEKGRVAYSVLYNTVSCN